MESAECQPEQPGRVFHTSARSRCLALTRETESQTWKYVGGAVINRLEPRNSIKHGFGGLAISRACRQIDIALRFGACQYFCYLEVHLLHTTKDLAVCSARRPLPHEDYIWRGVCAVVEHHCGDDLCLIIIEPPNKGSDNPGRCARFVANRFSVLGTWGRDGVIQQPTHGFLFARY